MVDLPAVAGGAISTAGETYDAVVLSKLESESAFASGKAVREIWLTVEGGVMVIRDARMPFRPSAKTPP